MKHLLLIALILLAALPASAYALAPGEKPRVLLALYSSKEHANPRDSWAHRFLEMPLNHMGYYLRFVDVEQPFPEVAPDVKGIVIWMSSGRYVADADAYLDWLQQAVDTGRKLILFDDIGISDTYRTQPGALDKLNRLLGRIGMRDMDSFNSITYQSSVLYQNPDIIGFERDLPESLPQYQETIAIPGVGVSHLRVLASKAPETIHDLVITGPSGGYVAGGYSLFQGYPLLPIEQMEEQKHIPETERHRPDPVHQWYINPFKFLKAALGEPDGVPVPDVTTAGGLRIFYSHIDGDGWNNVTQIKKYAKRKMLSAEVIKQEVLAAYPDMPVNVSIIGAEMDMECYGLRASREVAREIFRLPNVEPSSHSYSHPLFWGYFREYDPAREASILQRYPPRPRRGSVWDLLPGGGAEDAWQPYRSNAVAVTDAELEGYDTPRSYACTPFDMKEEIEGSIALVKELSPKKKRGQVRLIQWSGDTTPYEEALAAVHGAKLLNINGGDSRYDSEYPSYASVSPIGAQVGGMRQIYSSNSNENTYTNLWTDRFFGFIYLQTTVRNTEMPMRVQPFNIYYHMYSGERQASLAALRSNMEFAAGQDLHRMFASDFAEIADGYYHAALVDEGNGRWRIKDRGKLNTVRIDKASLMTVDFAQSSGVLGQRHYQGSLYVLLDPLVQDPQIKLKKGNMHTVYQDSGTPYVIFSSWLIKELIYLKKSLMFSAQGHGDGKISLKFPLPGEEFEVIAQRQPPEMEELLRKRITSNADGRVSFTLDIDARESVDVMISPVGMPKAQ